MNHKEIHKKLLLYIDNELSQADMADLKGHIDGCPACKKKLIELSKLWVRENPADRARLSPYIWTKLEAEIKNYEQNPVLFDFVYFTKKFVFVLQPVIIVVLIFIAIFTGYYHGNFLSKDFDANVDISSREQVAKAFYLDRLNPQLINIASNLSEEEMLK